MNIFFNTLRCDFKRTIFSLRFLVAVLGFTLITIITMIEELSYMPLGVTSLVYIYQIINYLDFYIIYLIFAAIPGTLLFCSDWDNRFMRFSVVRCSKRIYAISKVLACFCSAICVVILSQSLTLLLFSFGFPIFNVNDTGLGIYSSFGSTNQIWMYFAVKILCKAFCAGFLSVFALWFSTKIINAYVALATPLLAYYLIVTLSAYFKIPALFNIGYLAKGYISIGEDPLHSFLFTILIFTVAAIIFGSFFVSDCKRRIENG